MFNFIGGSYHSSVMQCCSRLDLKNFLFEFFWCLTNIHYALLLSFCPLTLGGEVYNHCISFSFSPWVPLLLICLHLPPMWINKYKTNPGLLTFPIYSLPSLPSLIQSWLSRVCWPPPIYFFPNSLSTPKPFLFPICLKILLLLGHLNISLSRPRWYPVASWIMVKYSMTGFDLYVHIDSFNITDPVSHEIRIPVKPKHKFLSTYIWESSQRV